MVGIALKKYAKEHGLTCEGGFAFGVLHGYAVSMDDGADRKRLFIHTRFADAEKKAAFETMLGKAELYSQYRVQNTTFRDSLVCFSFLDKIGTMGLIEQFIDWLLPQLPQYDAAGADICPECSCAMNGQVKWAVIDSVPRYMHESCLQSVKNTIRAQEGAAKETAGGSYLTGAIGALIGGLLGAVVWGFILKLGWMAGVVGLLIGFLAEKGYTLLKGRLGKGKLFILIAVIILSVAAGTILGEYLSLSQAIKDENIFIGRQTVPEFLRNCWKVDAEFRSSVIGDLVKNGLLGLLFAGFGAFSMLLKTKDQVSDTKIKELK